MLFVPEVLGCGPRVGGLDGCHLEAIISLETGTGGYHTDIRAQSCVVGQRLLQTDLLYREAHSGVSSLVQSLSCPVSPVGAGCPQLCL